MGDTYTITNNASRSEALNQALRLHSAGDKVEDVIKTAEQLHGFLVTGPSSGDSPKAPKTTKAHKKA